jgi:hypothetical protein
MADAAGQAAPQNGGERRSESGFDINRVVASMLGREKGNAKAVIRHLVREGRRYRLRIKTLEDDLAGRPEKLAEGGVILKPEDAKKWNVLKDITLTPEQVKEALKRKDELEGQLTAQKQAELVESAAESLGVKRPKLLAEQVGTKKMVAEERDVEVEREGKRVKEKQVQVRPAGDEKAAWRSMKDFVDNDLKDLHPALFADPEPEDSASGQQPSQGETAVYPAQRGARGRAPVKGDVVVKTLGDRYLSPSESRKQSK